jgi:hypothetical protein
MSVYFHTAFQWEELGNNMAVREKYTLGQLDAFDFSFLTFIYFNRICNLTDYILLADPSAYAV